MLFHNIFGRFFGSAATGGVMGGAAALFFAATAGVGVGIAAFAGMYALLNFIIPGGAFNLL